MTRQAWSCAAKTGLESKIRAYYNDCPYADRYGIAGADLIDNNEDRPFPCYTTALDNDLCIGELIQNVLMPETM